MKNKSPSLGKSVLSVNQASSDYGGFESYHRKQVLWNIVEPGDPYDIRKSTINRIYKDSKNFMGENTEIICLLQAAEIERLNQFLIEYTNRYRQFERRELDRHSYEVQIKQLHQQLNQQSQMGIQSNKMNDFVRKLTEELNEYKNRAGNDQQLRYNYEAALRQIEEMRNFKLMSQREIQNLKFELSNFNTRYQILEETKNRQIEEYRHQLFTNAPKVQSPNTNNELTNLKLRYESQVNLLENEARRMKDQLQRKSIQIRELNNRNTYLIKQIESKGSNNSNVSQSAYEAKIALLSQEMERISMILKQSTSALDEKSKNELLLNEKYTNLENQYIELDLSYKQLQIKYDSMKTSQQYQSGSTTERTNDAELHRLNLQIRRLEQQAYNHHQKYQEAVNKLQEIEYYYSNQHKSMNDLESYSREQEFTIQGLRSRNAELQSSMALLSQQLQRTTIQANSRIESYEYNNLQIAYNQLQQQFEFQTRASSEQNQQLLNKYESEIANLKNYYEERISTLSHNNNSAVNNATKITLQFERKLEGIILQTNKLNNIINDKTQQNNNLRNRINGLEQEIYQKYQIETQQKNYQYEENIRELRFKIQQFGSRERQMENQIRKLHQVERLNEGLKRDNDRLIRDLNSVSRQIEMRRRSQGDINRTVENYHREMAVLKHQNERMMGELQALTQYKNKTSQYEHKSAVMSREIENLNKTLNSRIQTINRSEQMINNLKQELHKTTIHFQQNLQTSSRKTQQQANNYITQISNLQNKIASLQRENQQLSNLRQQTMFQANKSNENLQQVQVKFTAVQQNLQLKINQYHRAEEVINNQQIMINNLQNEIRNLQKTINQKYQFEYRKNIANLQQTNQMAAQELENWRRKTNQLEGKLQMKQVEFDRITQQLTSFQSENQHLVSQIRNISEQSLQKNNQTRRELHQIENERNQLNNKLIQLEKNRLTALNRQNDELTLKLQQSEIKIYNITGQLQFLKNNGPKDQSKQEQYYKQLQKQLEMWQNRCKELEITIPRKYQVEYQQKISLYEHKLRNSGNELASVKNMNEELQRSLRNYEADINRLNENLRRQGIQSENIMKARLRENQAAIIQKMEIEVNQQKSIYQQNINQLNHEHQRQRRIIREYQQEIQALRNKNEELRITNIPSINNNHEIETLRKKLRELEQQLNGELRNRRQLEGELSVLKSAATYKHNTENITSLSDSNTELMELLEYRKLSEMRLSEYENKVRYLEQQNGGLSKQIYSKNQEIAKLSSELWNMHSEMESMTRRMNQFEAHYLHNQSTQPVQPNRFEQQLRNSRMQEQINNQNYHYETRISELTQELQSLTKERNQQKMKYENKINILKQEIERLNEALTMLNNNQAIQMTNSIKMNQEELEKLKRQLANRENRVEILQQELERMNEALSTKEEYILRLKEDVNGMTVEIESLKRMGVTSRPETSHFLKEIQQLKQLLKQKTIQYEQIYVRYKELVTMQEEYLMMTEQYESSKKNIMQYQMSVTKLYNEFDRLQNVINELKTDRQSYFDKSQTMKIQLQKLHSEQRMRQEQIQELRVNITDQYSLQKRIKEDMGLMVILFAEIETLRKQLAGKQNFIMERGQYSKVMNRQSNWRNPRVSETMA